MPKHENAVEVIEQPVSAEQAVQDVLNATNNAESMIYQHFTQYLASLMAIDQRAALEQKFLALAPEIRSASDSQYPQLKTYEKYIVRQMRREANGKLASNKRPEWFSMLSRNARDLQSSNEEIRKYAESELKKLADELDSKESATLLKKYKISKDMTSDHDHIKQLALLFGIDVATLK